MSSNRSRVGGSAGLAVSAAQPSSHSSSALGPDINAMVTYAPAMQRIVITGLGVVTPFGTETGAFADALLAGRSAVAPLTQFPVDGCHARCAASVQGFEAARWIPPLKSRRMDMTSQYAIA